MGALENAKARKKALLAELSRIEKFMRDYQDFASGEVSKPRTERTFIRGHKDEVLQQIIALLSTSPERMSTADIAARIARSGFVVRAKNPRAYIGVIIHRNQDKIDRSRADGGSRLRKYPREVAV